MIRFGKFSLLLVALLFVVSCTPGGGGGGIVPIDLPEIRVGTQGVVATFLQARPPDEVFEGSDQRVAFSLHNQGSQDVRRGVYRLVTNRPSLFILDTQPTGLFDLLGKSQADIRGEELFFDELVQVGGLPSNSQGESGRLDLHLCYQYATLASQEVCVDATLGAETITQKVCRQSPVSTSGGQGAPIQLTQVDLKTTPHSSNDRLVVPIAELTFQKPSGKTVTLPNEYDNRCTGRAVTVNEAEAQVFLGEERMTCTSRVRFDRSDTSKITCRLESGIEKIRGAYISTIRAELDYGYYDIAAKKTIRVQKLN